MFSKFGKEKKIVNSGEFRIKYGTIDAVKLNSIYLCIESWVQPIEESLDFEKYIKLMRRNLILSISKKINKHIFNENFIVDLDLRSSGMDIKRKSFMLLEVTVYPKIKPKFNSEILFNSMSDVSNIITETLKTNKLIFKSNKNGR